MLLSKSSIFAGSALAVAAGIGLFVAGEFTPAADHNEPALRTNPAQDNTPDRAADIADVFAWAEDGNLNLVLTVAGPAPVDEPAVYDRDVLYGIHISTDDDATTTEERLLIRFGQAGENNNGVLVENIPGVGTIEGPVETDLADGGVRVRAALHDDPFYFDSQGLNESRATGTIQISNERDFFANANITTVIIQIPLENFGAVPANLAVWSESSRFGGNL